MEARAQRSFSNSADATRNISHHGEVAFEDLAAGARTIGKVRRSGYGATARGSGKPATASCFRAAPSRARSAACAERIAGTLKLGEDVVGGMFGPPRNAKPLRAGRLRVEEVYTMASRLWAQGRVKDPIRFTGGAFPTALFNEAPFYPEDDESATMTFRFELDAPKDKEIALLLLTFKDLWLGDLPLGGETGVGRGVFEGVEATFRSDGEESQPRRSRKSRGNRVQSGRSAGRS